MIDALFSLSDSNLDNKINVREFARFFRLMNTVNNLDFEHALFAIADKNFDNLVDKNEIKAICRQLNWVMPA